MGKKKSRQVEATFPSEPQPLPAVADAIDARSEVIVSVWTAQVRQLIPETQYLPSSEVEDHLPQILSAMAEALRTIDPTSRHRLMERSPMQGITRFQQHYDIRDLMSEDRLLRRILIDQVEDVLGQPMSLPQQLGLNTAIDLMLQQSVVAFVEHQAGQVRSAAEAELKYLSFLSHDLNNHLSNVTVWLQVLRVELANQPQCAEQVAALDTAQQAILTTIGGMGKLLQAERLRKGGEEAKSIPIDLRTLIANETRQIARQLEQKDLAVSVEVPKEAVVESDPELLSLVLQNLIGNAVKYSVKGTIRIRVVQDLERASKRWLISVSDEGPGIAIEHVDRIFQAFRRAEIHGQIGVGLGLAIASQAAKLMNAELKVESILGSGSTFTLSLPG